MDKNTIISILQSMDVENKDKLQEYINKVDKANEDMIQTILIQNNIKTEEDLKKYVINNVEAGNNFIQLNELVSYGKTGDTLHIHVVPKDAKFLLSKNGLNMAEYELIDSLEKIQDCILNNEELKDVKQIYAVSGLIKKPISNLFENLEFDVKSMKINDAKNDEELKYFYERFKDKNSLGRAKLSKEKLYSEEWNKLKNERKKELNSKMKLEEVNDMARISVIEDMGEKLIKEIQRNNEKEI